jgi:outer membrane receptor for ferrienterochelin and colicin
MQWMKTILFIAACSLVTTSVFAQTTTGTITGRIVDTQDLPVPGVTVTAASAALQGVQVAVSSEHGNYILPLLPPGTYLVTFELAGFQTHERTVTVAATQTVPLNVALGPAAVEEAIVVVGRAADVLTQTAQVATNFRQDVIAALPTNRDLTSTLLMAPAVHPSGPAGSYSIAGAMSFESLFLVNGVTANENIRRQPFNLYIEDAIQETVVASDGVSAEYGRFSGGVVNIITKSGTNEFAGSLRDTLYNDNWRSLVVGNRNFAAAGPDQRAPECNFVIGPGGGQIRDPHCFSGDSKVAKVVPTYEYVVGGPIVKNRLTFFTAGRLQNQQLARSTVAPLSLPYVAEDRRQRYEIKLTGSLSSNHRLEGSYQREAARQVNHTFNTATSMDLRSLYTRETPLQSFQASYNGILSNTLFVEGRVSVRTFKFIGNGATTTDLIDGTLVYDRTRANLAYWSPTLCGVCGDEARNNDNEYVKATYFKSTRRGGSHTVVFGFDTFNDKWLVNNHQSGSDYQIFGTTSIVRQNDADCSVSPGCIFPQFLPGSTLLRYTPIALSSQGTDIRTHALFVNDQIRWGPHLTLNLGVRWDKNDAVDSGGNRVASDSKLAPRVGMVWDPKGDGVWGVSASYGTYTAALAGTIGGAASAAGVPAVILWAYTGPEINPDPNSPTASLVPPVEAIQQVFDWCARDARGFCTAAPPAASVVPGVSVRIGEALDSPSVNAYAIGVSRQLGGRVVARADYSYRDYRDFYSRRIDRTTGLAVDELGNRSDVAIVENTNDVERRYSGLTLSTTYRVNRHINVGGNYTLSRLRGNFDGETLVSGPVAADLFQYPEYRDRAWYAPRGNLGADQRHRSSIWMIAGVPAVSGLTFSVLQHLASGLPYGAVGPVDARPYVTNPGYVTPQGAASQNYYFTTRHAFRTKAHRRTDIAVSYSYPLRYGVRKLEPFVQAHLINVFDQQDLCACGGTVFENGGGVALNRLGAGVLTPVNTPALARFNPFSETPVQGVHWNYAPNYGTPLNRFAFTMPRMFRLGFGVRF